MCLSIFAITKRTHSYRDPICRSDGINFFQTLCLRLCVCVFATVFWFVTMFSIWFLPWFHRYIIILAVASSFWRGKEKTRTSNVSRSMLLRHFAPCDRFLQDVASCLENNYKKNSRRKRKKNYIYFQSLVVYFDRKGAKNSFHFHNSINFFSFNKL